MFYRISFGEQIGFKKPEDGFATKAIHVGQEPELWNCRYGKNLFKNSVEINLLFFIFYRAVVPLISLATTYKQFAPGQHNGK